MKKQYLFIGLLALSFSTNLLSENRPDFWFLPFSIFGQNPPCSISGPDYVCDNSTGNIYSGPAGMSSYSWSITGSGSIPGPTNGETVSVTSGNFINDYTLTLTVSDANGNTSTCTKTSFIFLNTPPANITINPAPACLGVTLDLSIIAAASSTVAWSGEGVTDPDGTFVPFDGYWYYNETNAVPASSGLHTYSVTVTSDYGCVSTGTATVTIGQEINLSTTVTNTCGGGSTGAINLTVSDGTPAFTYSWTGGATTEDRSNLAAGTYTVTVSDAGGCSKTISTTVGQNPLPTASISQTPNDTICKGVTGTITASGGQSYLWSTGDVTPTIQVTPMNSSNFYTVTVTGANGCTNTAFAVFWTYQPFSLNPPTIVQPITCTSSDGSITLDIAGSSGLYSYNWSTPNGSGLVQGQKNQSGLTVGTYNVTVNSSYGCSATASYVLTGPGGCDCPTIGSLSASPSPACVNENVTLTASGLVNMGSTYGIVFKSFAAPTADPYTGGTTLATVNNNQLGGGGTSATATVTFASNGTKYLYAILTPLPSAPACRPSATTTLNVDIIPPSITCPANTTVNANASCQGQVGSYSAATLSDNCNANPTVTQSPAASTLLSGHNATQTVTLTANDGNGNTATCTLVVTLKDVTAPSITCPANTTVNANASCQGQVGSYSAATLSDNCNANPTVTQSPAASTLLSGHNATQTVTLTANDGNGNTATCTLVVTLKDVTAPSITCPANTTVNANASCQGQVGSYSAATLSDNCNANPTVTQSPAASTLLSGHNATQTVTLTANDGNGNTATCSLVVTLKDVTKPNLTCPANLTINANASCSGTLSTYAPTTLSDNCTANPSLTQSPAAGTSITGHNTVRTVTLTATDGAGNTQTCTLTVTLKDVTPPTIVCKTYIANLDASGNVSITPTDVYQSGSDNCGVVNLVSVVGSSFTCSNIGNNLVTLTANDGNGNTSTCIATVIVRDVIPPVAKCQNVTANLGSNGTVTVPANAINNGSTDNCSITFTLTPNTFNCSQIGIQTVTLKATDSGANMSTCTARVTVRDISGPIAKCKNPTIYLDVAGHVTLTAVQVDNGSTDNCGISTRTIDVTEFNCSNLGSTWPVRLTLKDLNGNVSSCLSYVTVKDAIVPTAICEDVTVQLGSNGKVVVYTADLAFNSTDNCSVWSYSPIAKVYGTANLGDNNLTITVKDWSGNASTCVSVVTVLPYNANSDYQQGGGDGKIVSPGTFELLVYPNPSSGEATMAFQLPSEQTFSFRLFDTAGRMIYQRVALGLEGENIQPLDLAGFAPGVYWIDFQSENWKVQKQLVLQR